MVGYPHGQAADADRESLTKAPAGIDLVQRGRGKEAARNAAQHASDGAPVLEPETPVSVRRIAHLSELLAQKEPVQQVLAWHQVVEVAGDEDTVGERAPGLAQQPCALNEAMQRRKMNRAKLESFAVRLEPGRITVEFDEPQQGLEKPLALAMAISNDFDLFERCVARRG